MDVGLELDQKYLHFDLALHFFKNIVRILSFWLLINGQAFKMIFRNEFRTDNLVKHAGVSERGENIEHIL